MNQAETAQLMEKAYLEVIPTATIADRLLHLPQHAYVAITCSPVHGMGPTIEMVQTLSQEDRGHRQKLVPHIAARVVRNRQHLVEIVSQFRDCGVESVFVPGGDAPEPLGEYDCSLDLLRDLAEMDHGFEDVGVASHPEGHPLVSQDRLDQALLDKVEVCNYLVTQMCFEPDVLIDWLRRMRELGVSMPAWLGLPGVAEISKLISLSLRIGVGQSVRVLRKQKGLLKKLATGGNYKPDDLLQGLQPHFGDPELNIAGFHLFSFNNVEKTEGWRQDKLKKLLSES